MPLRRLRSCTSLNAVCFIHKRYDTTHLHIREWLECIRQGKQPSCNIDAAFQEAMTAHMGTHAYLEGRTMYWDKEKEEIVKG